METLAEQLGVTAEHLPLFPTARGEEVDKSAAVATINRLVELLGRPAQQDGAWLSGGHSLRTGGAHLLAAQGVNA